MGPTAIAPLRPPGCDQTVTCSLNAPLVSGVNERRQSASSQLDWTTSEVPRSARPATWTRATSREPTRRRAVTAAPFAGALMSTSTRAGASVATGSGPSAEPPHDDSAMAATNNATRRPWGERGITGDASPPGPRRPVGETL